jgi:hypothetical protein
MRSGPIRTERQRRNGPRRHRGWGRKPRVQGNIPGGSRATPWSGEPPTLAHQSGPSLRGNGGQMWVGGEAPGPRSHQRSGREKGICVLAARAPAQPPGGDGEGGQAHVSERAGNALFPPAKRSPKAMSAGQWGPWPPQGAARRPQADPATPQPGKEADRPTQGEGRARGGSLAQPGKVAASDPAEYSVTCLKLPATQDRSLDMSLALYAMGGLPDLGVQ